MSRFCCFSRRRPPARKSPRLDVGHQLGARVLEACLLALTLGGLSACGECRTDHDCGKAGSTLLQCSADRVCVPAVPTVGASCSDANPCAGPATNTVCEDGTCHFKPSCQVLTGTWQLKAICDDNGTFEATATASTDQCTVTIGTDEIGDFSFRLPSETIAVVDGLENSNCAASRFSAAESTLALSGCSVGTTRCDVVLRSDAKPGAPCLVGNPAETCGATCALVSGFSPDTDVAGVCR